MNKSYLLLAFLTVFSITTIAQEADTSQVKKEKMYTVLGNSWKVTKYEDGTKIIEWEEEKEDYTPKIRNKRSKFHYNFLEAEVGINLYPIDKGAPQVKPWGSWFVGLHSVGTWKLSKNFHLRSTMGVEWYNFKFEDRNIIAVKNPDGLDFVDFDQLPNGPEGTPTKSKISASYASISLVPTIRTNDGNFRFGVGGYAGLRLGGRGKYVYDDADGSKQKSYTKSNMYFENFRYGLRSEIGVGDVTFFFNYDLNDLFQPGLGPELQAMSFGIRLD
ncbi:MAG: outer membrane beta-barrel protein [Algoriphagus sp.]|uniref:outer membrane beta-barrel protein n=1 Tax=Algoriphagus sp. TaxID=1872435 RepID=UPI001831B562|nr:outer membrane beta-barrel protein [Algoriphagus sp.]NVJ85802.1 outer membrane beta-barrel protein [Algoriphagus sp.]